MSVSTATEISNLVSHTAQERAKTDTLTGAANELTSTDFLNLMMEQLKYQDPLDPVSNSEFIAQQAQFSQLEATQEISETLAQSTTVTQALTLVDKHVILQDPNDATKVLSGNVDAVYMNGENTSITVGGKNYPLSSVLYVFDSAATDDTPDTAADSDSSTETPAT